MADPCESCKGGTCEVKETLVDYVTGREVPDTDIERVRQRVERFLVEEKGYSKGDIERGVSFEMEVAGSTLTPRVDLVVKAHGKCIILIKCMYGALEAGMRLVVSYGRLLDTYQIPFSVVTNGDEGHVFDTVTGRELGGMEVLPNKSDLDRMDMEFIEYPPERVEKEARILNAYESINQDLCLAFED
jgi:hypothetical protein